MEKNNPHYSSMSPAKGRVHSVLLAFSLLFGSASAAAQSVELVKDINPGKRDASPEEITIFDNRMYFRANDGVHGSELWVSDGTESGTYMLKDINPGQRGSEPHGFTVYAGRLYFAADDGEHGDELWVTDGTTAGTRMVEDINPGRRGSNPSNLAVHGGKLYFQADDGTTGSELHVLDAGGVCGLALDAAEDEVRQAGFADRLSPSNAYQTGTYSVQSGLEDHQEWAMFPQGALQQSGQTVELSSGIVGFGFSPEKIPESDRGNVVYSLRFYNATSFDIEAEVRIAHSDGFGPPAGYYVFAKQEGKTANILLSGEEKKPDQIGVYFDPAYGEWGVSIDGTDYGYQFPIQSNSFVPALNVGEAGGGQNKQDASREGDEFVGTFITSAADITAWMPSSAVDHCGNVIEQ